jgi:hypothetical protein
VARNGRVRELERRLDTQGVLLVLTACAVGVLFSVLLKKGVISAKDFTDA